MRRKKYPGETPVYNAQVKTFSVARTLPGDWRLLRLLPLYRDETARQIRRQTAAAVRVIRKANAAFPTPLTGGIATPIPERYCAVS